jgi:hypothetical protein
MRIFRFYHINCQIRFIKCCCIWISFYFLILCSYFIITIITIITIIITIITIITIIIITIIIIIIITIIITIIIITIKINKIVSFDMYSIVIMFVLFYFLDKILIRCLYYYVSSSQLFDQIKQKYFNVSKN